jgi:NADP-reducing hydrogenase subunit HndB
VDSLKNLVTKDFLTLQRTLRDRKPAPVTVIVHMGTCGIASGSEDVLEAIREAAKDLGGEGVTIKTSGCAGLCSREPMLTVEVAGTPPVKYCNINPLKARKIYSEHVIGGKPVDAYALGAGCERLY